MGLKVVLLTQKDEEGEMSDWLVPTADGTPPSHWNPFRQRNPTPISRPCL